MNRDEANLLVDLYGRHIGAKGAKLNEHDLVLFLWEDGQIYMQHLPDEGQLVCGAKIHKFHREIRHDYFEALQAEAQRGRDTGGGELVLDEESKRVFLRRSWTELPKDQSEQEAFCAEVDRLAKAGLEWMQKVYGEVIFPIMAKEREEGSR